MRYSNPEGGRTRSKYNEALTEDEIIMNQIQRCIQKGSVEWSGGYWKESRSADGVVDRYYVPSTTEVFCNSVLMLKILLRSHFKEEIKEEVSKIEKSLNNFEEGNKEKIKESIKLLEVLLKHQKMDNFGAEEETEEVIEA